MKNFLCVKFKHYGNTDIVPKCWMVDKESCRWPPHSTGIEELVKFETEPEISWKVYACEILCGSSKLILLCYSAELCYVLQYTYII